MRDGWGLEGFLGNLNPELNPEGLVGFVEERGSLRDKERAALHIFNKIGSLSA